MKQQRLSNMTETNRIEFKRELTDDLDIEKLMDDGLHEYNKRQWAIRDPYVFSTTTRCEPCGNRVGGR